MFHKYSHEKLSFVQNLLIFLSSNNHQHALACFVVKHYTQSIIRSFNHNIMRNLKYYLNTNSHAPNDCFIEKNKRSSDLTNWRRLFPYYVSYHEKILKNTHFKVLPQHLSTLRLTSKKIQLVCENSCVFCFYISHNILFIFI